MKLFFKENKTTIVVYIIMLILIFFGVSEYNSEYGYQKRVEQHEHAVKYCKELDYSTLTEEEQEFMQDVCELRLNEEVKMDDTVTTFFYILSTRKLNAIYLIIPIFIMICSIKKWHDYMKSGVIKNALTREKYSKCLRKGFLSCYKQVAVFLGFILLIFGVSFIISGHFDYTISLSYSGLIEHDFLLKMPYSLIIFFIILILSYFMYVNLTLISAKYNKNYYVCIIISFLLWLALSILTEVIIGGYIFWVFLEIDIGPAFNLFALYNTWTVKEQFIQLCVTFTLTLISFIIVYLVYRKKEGVVIASEK